MNYLIRELRGILHLAKAVRAMIRDLTPTDDKELW
jgi:hypothetical protein